MTGVDRSRSAGIGLVFFHSNRAQLESEHPDSGWRKSGRPTSCQKLCQNTFKINKSRDILVNGKVAHAHHRQHDGLKLTGDAGLEEMNNFYSLFYNDH